ncbi:MAG: 30S ribosomal protein S17 [Phycisphaerae bacterium]|nr:30S ribosomal protein S17 [Phycisphaerae bacterium]
MTEATEQKQKPKARRTRVGTVVSAREDKTARVVLQTLVKHRQYGKYIRKRTKLAVHDPQNQAQEGDQVEIAPCRPLSKSKSWRLVRVVRTREIER